MHNSIIRDSTKYVGISNTNKISNSNFKFFNISSTMALPSNMLQSIVQVNCDIHIDNYKIIKTPKGVSYEGQILTGNKLFFKGIIHCNIQYTTINNENEISFLSFNKPFVESFTVPSDYSFNSKINSIYTDVVDISAIKINDKSIYLNLVICASS